MLVFTVYICRPAVRVRCGRHFAYSSSCTKIYVKSSLNLCNISSQKPLTLLWVCAILVSSEGRESDDQAGTLDLGRPGRISESSLPPLTHGPWTLSCETKVWNVTQGLGSIPEPRSGLSLYTRTQSLALNNRGQVRLLLGDTSVPYPSNIQIGAYNWR